MGALYRYKGIWLYFSYEGEKLTELGLLRDKPEPYSGICNTAFSDKVFSEMTEYFEGKRKSFDIKLMPSGTEFQKKVYNELLKIPYGETRSYADIAAGIGNEKACRAVGSAIHRNPIFVIIPCHRVIGSSGGLVGYAGGLDLKRALLDLEKGKSADFFFGTEKSEKLV